MPWVITKLVGCSSSALSQGRATYELQLTPWSKVVGVAAELLPQPRQIVVHIVHVGVVAAGIVQEAIVQDDVLKAQLGTLGVDVHLADGLGLVAMPGELAGQRGLIVPGNAILIAHAAVGALRLAGE